MNTTGICRECEIEKAPQGDRTCGQSECQEAAHYFAKVLCCRPGTKKHTTARQAYQAKKAIAVARASIQISRPGSSASK